MPTILYAEDDRDCRELFSFVLRQKDFTVYEANNGAQAVQLVREEPIDLVILDVRMPMMSGYDAARLIAQEAPNIPIIFLSAKGLNREVDKGFNSGFLVVDYLIKPVPSGVLVAHLKNLIRRARAEQVAIDTRQNPLGASLELD